jgi:hypothetical protein
MRRLLESIAIALLVSGVSLAQSMPPAEALERYLTVRPPACSDATFAIQIEASLPKLKKHGSMSGLKLVSQTGQIVYRGLRFTGDNLVKTAVIARFLSNEAQPPAQASTVGIARRNYSFAYERTADYNGQAAYVYRVKPLRKRIGLFRGELWLDANTGAALRLWGDFVKSPSFFIRSLRFVQDYQQARRCVEPARLLVTVQTRIAGEADMTVWLRPVENRPGEDTVAAAADAAPVGGGDSQ